MRRQRDPRTATPKNEPYSIETPTTRPPLSDASDTLSLAQAQLLHDLRPRWLGWLLRSEPRRICGIPDSCEIRLFSHDGRPDLVVTTASCERDLCPQVVHRRGLEWVATEPVEPLDRKDCREGHIEWCSPQKHHVVTAGVSRDKAPAR